MEVLVGFLRFEIGLLLGGLIFVVIYRLVTGQINLSGLLTDGETGNFSPGRLQLLAFTLAGALYYIYLAASNPGQLPQFPQELLFLFGGSQLVYLGGKSIPRGG